MSRDGGALRAVPRELAALYVQVLSPAGAWIARRECAEALGRGDADFLLLERPRRRASTASGRGPAARLRLSGGPAVGKRALHGGLLGPVLGGLYLGAGRAVEQLRAAARLERAGVPTPALLAVGQARVLGPCRALAILSREIEDARNLYELAGENPPPGRRRAVLLECAEALRRMHGAGFLHADLNVGNLVLGRAGGVERAHVVDLDRGRFRAAPSRRDRLANLARLLRSYEKWIAPRIRLSPREEIRFLRRYAGPDRALLRFLARRLERVRARLALRRLRWRLVARAGSGDRRSGPPQ